MRNITKRVVILNNFSSPYVCEAIVILKDYDPRFESKAIRDAERVVTEYIEKINKNGESVKPIPRRKSRYIKYIAAAIALAAAAAYFILK
ncbi:MAG: hypothetical protein ACI4C7_08700 [Clostridia bacterium]